MIVRVGLAGLLAALSLPGYDFTLGLGGSSVGYAGHTLYLEIQAELTEGERDYVEYETPGLPAGFSVTYPDLDRYCCRGNRAWSPHNTRLRVSLDPGVEIGSYELQLVAVSGGVERRASHGLQVVSTDWLPFPAPLAESTEPLVDLWESNMNEHGGRHCNKEAIDAAGVWDGGVQFYDGARAYLRIAEYTNDDEWIKCAGWIREVYLRYLEPVDGGVTGWRVFPHGLRRHFEMTGDERSRKAVFNLSRRSAWAERSGGVPVSLSRETAYLVSANLAAEALGFEPQARHEMLISQLIGHLDQMFAPGEDPHPETQPVMVALSVEAAIEEWNKTRDARIPVAIQRAAHGLMTSLWIEDAQTFYRIPGDNSAAQFDVHLLVAPVFGWLYQQTGQQIYAQWGDKIFNSGVEGAWLQGKRFTQSYRWSFDYVRWRQEDEPSDSLPVVLDIDGDGVPDIQISRAP